eukprot:gene10805-3423_t
MNKFPNKYNKLLNIRGHFSDALIEICKNIDEYPKSLYYKDKECTVLYDGYPKSKYHLLIVPNDLSITNCSKLNKNHKSLLKHMNELAKEISKEINLQTDGNIEFKWGFHAIPSLKLLHLHLISQDFISPCLKNKKHWNSFTTQFFVSIDEVLKQIDENGKVNFDEKYYEKFEKQNLQFKMIQFKNIPELKKFLEEREKK